jgi:hypothetical protein
MSDPLETLLRAAPLNDRQRAGLWDTFEASKNADDLAARLQAMELPQDLKAQLWDLKSQGSAPEAAPVEAPAAHSWSDKLGLNQPTDSMLGGFLRGSGAAIVDTAQGAASEVSKMMGEKITTENQAASDLQPTNIAPRQMPEGLKTDAPPTAAGTVGTYAPAVAGMLAPAGPAVKAGQAAVKAIPSAARAGEKFQEVMGAAKNVVVDNAEVGDVALRIHQLADRGGSMPMAVRKLINYSTDPSKPAMTYEVSRDFASNISRLSKDDYGRMTKAVAREVAKLSATLNQANAKAAQAAGKGAEYKAAMREYARAMRIKDAIDATLSGAKKALPIAGAAGLGAWMTGKIVDAIQGQ